ncbi:MAG: transglutaminase family protein [Verrucomicrobia bacterium]|nr:transglutaminase family protein [Verrucomicrobiota bacterium]
MDAAKTSPQKPSERELRALVTLLEDDDPIVYRAVRSRLLSFGAPILHRLEPYLADPDPRIRRRCRAVAIRIRREANDSRLLQFCLRYGENLDLEEGLLLLAQTRFPDINPRLYREQLDAFARELAGRIVEGPFALTSLAAVNDYLFYELGFRGADLSKAQPADFYFNHVMDRRIGDPINLCALYWLVAQRLRMPVVGIGIPGYFLCRFQTAAESVYIDPFHQGRLLTRADCVRYLHNAHRGFQEAFLAPISPGRTLLRVCANLYRLYEEQKRAAEAKRLRRYIVALAR